MKPNFMRVLEMCIEDGTVMGLNRSFKHDDNPSSDIIIENVVREIKHQIYEWFDMEEE